MAYTMIRSVLPQVIGFPSSCQLLFEIPNCEEDSQLHIQAQSSKSWTPSSLSKASPTYSTQTMDLAILAKNSGYSSTSGKYNIGQAHHIIHNQTDLQNPW